MKGWQRDLFDHLVWLTLLHESDEVSQAEAAAAVQREFPRLVPAPARLQDDDTRAGR